jgi:UDP-4-amino-4,6-dideoxy-N-acetyl-beta-L-altrosamine transaminase
MKYIPYGKQNVTQQDINSVIEVLQSDFLTQGPQVTLFEKDVIDSVNAGYCVAVNSATSALHIACKALGLGLGDILWTSPNTFVASANCALYCNATVDFVDIDPNTYNICTHKLAEKLIWAEKCGSLPKILNVVHFAGQPAKMTEIKRLSEKYGFYIIEDASHAFGAKFQKSPVGDCKYSDICVFSFHPVKIITTGEGGVATTNCGELAKRMRLFRSHGVTRDPKSFSGVEEGDWYYEQQDLGFNYRMTDIHAALGRSQLKRISSIIEARNELSKAYLEKLRNLNLKLPTIISNCTSAMHLFPIQVQSSQKRLEVFNFLREANIGVNVHYFPVHLQPFFRKMSFKVGDFPVAENYYKKAISLPLYPNLQVYEQDYVVNKLNEALTL